jgi:hypothetical protein
MKKRFLLIIFIGLIILYSGISCQKKGKSREGTIQEKDGVLVIKNPGEPLNKPDVFFLEEDLCITSEEMDKEFIFQDLYDLVVDEDENIYVSDMNAAHILVFNKIGKLIRIIGKKGQGPGEIARPLSICISPPDKLLVVDVGQFCVHYFSLKGEFLEKFSTTTIGANFGYPKVDSKGNILAGYLIFGKETKTYTAKFNSELNPLFTVSSLPVVSKPSDGSSRAVFDFFEFTLGTNMVWDITRNDDILWGHFTKYEIHVFSPEGTHIKSILKANDPQKITEKEKERLLEESVPENSPYRALVEFPNNYPVFLHFTSDEEGRIFVQTYEKTQDGEKDYYDVFDSEGQYIAKIALKSRPYVWKNKKLYTIELDDNGFQKIKRFSVFWKY